MRKTKKPKKNKAVERPAPPPAPPCQLYIITPPVIADMDAFLLDLDAALAAAPVEHHVACLQIRLKDMNGIALESSALVQAAQAITPICHQYGVTVVLNDRPDLVADCGADGVHIGQGDMDYISSRELLGGDAIIGVTCHNSRELAFSATKAGADYVAFGAFFDSPTKATAPRAELEILQWWHQAVEIPCVAIGGINVSNAAQVIEAGADFIALSSGIWKHPPSSPENNGPAQAVQILSKLCLEHSR